MDISIFLAKAVGLYLVVVGFSGLVNAKKIKTLLQDMTKNQGLLFLSGFMALIIGILMITSHNLWAYDWRVIITIAGWMSFLKGTLLVVFPQQSVLFSGKLLDCKASYYFSFLFSFLIGGYLCYLGTIHSNPPSFL